MSCPRRRRNTGYRSTDALKSLYGHRSQSRDYPCSE